ncbi:MAG: transposase [bacterium]
MAIIAQKELFCWSDIEELGDLERLMLVFESLPDEALMRRLEAQRGSRGRDDYPVRPVWNSLLASIVFQHPSIEALRRELSRNGQLRLICGFPAVDGERAVPTASVYTRFLAKLFEDEHNARELRDIFDTLVQRCSEVLSGFGERLGGDGKPISSFARRQGTRPADRRGEHDADWGRHEHHHSDAEGTTSTTVKRWFGFTLHLLADTAYELPVNFAVTPASYNEMPVMHELIDDSACRYPGIVERAQMFTGDRGLDDGKLVEKLWEYYRIKPVIDIRNLWKDGEESKRVPGTENVVYDYKGTVSCVCPESETERVMAYGGFEANRGTLKYRCPASHYGVECAGAAQCPLKDAIRIPLSVDRRVFTPVARSSYRWSELYRERTAVERINGRIDRSFGFELHTTRGLEKMRMRVTVACAVMLAMALGRAQRNEHRLVRSLVRRSA